MCSCPLVVLHGGWQRRLFNWRDECSDQFRADLTECGLFTNFITLSNVDFESLISLIRPIVSKQHTNYRNSVSVNDCMAFTRSLATGDSYTSLVYFFFKIPKENISEIVLKMCRALFSSLSEYVKTPANYQEWELLLFLQISGNVTIV